MENHESAQKIITDERFNEMLEQVTDGILRTTKGTDAILPMIHALTTNGEDVLMPITSDYGDFNSPDGRRKALRKAGGEIASQNIPPACLFLTTEAWAVKAESLNIDKSPSRSPDRMEVATISGQTIDGRCNMASAEIIRRKSNNHLLFKYPIFRYYQKDDGDKTQAFLLRAFWRGYKIVITSKMAEAKTGFPIPEELLN